MLNNEQINQLYELYINPPFMPYKELAEFIKKEFKIDIDFQYIRKIMLKKDPNMGKSKVKNRAKWKETEKNNNKFIKYKFIVIDDVMISEKENEMLELWTNGKSQNEISGLMGISQAQVSRILKKLPKVEIQQVKKNRIIAKFNGIDINELKIWFNETNSIKEVLEKCISKGLRVNKKDIIFILENNFNAKKYCKKCNEEMGLNRQGYCSEECRKEKKLDRLRTRMHNARGQKSKTMLSCIDKDELIKKANYTCYLCAGKLDTNIKDPYHPLFSTLEHKDSLARSNNNSENNLTIAHRCCGTMKSDKPVDYYSKQVYIDNRIKKLQSYVPKERNLPKINKAEFLNDCKEGMTVNDLCNKYNRSNYSIAQHKKKFGAPLKYKTPVKLKPEYGIEKVASLSKEGESISNISKMLNICEATVSKFRKKALEKGLL